MVLLSHFVVATYRKFGFRFLSCVDVVLSCLVVVLSSLVVNLSYIVLSYIVLVLSWLGLPDLYLPGPTPGSRIMPNALMIMISR